MNGVNKAFSFEHLFHSVFTLRFILFTINTLYIAKNKVIQTFE